jgi:hypothetical protein
LCTLHQTPSHFPRSYAVYDHVARHNFLSCTSIQEVKPKKQSINGIHERSTVQMGQVLPPGTMSGLQMQIGKLHF